MHLLDPARPKFGNHPAYVFDGRIIGPMPVPQVIFHLNGEMSVQFMLLVEQHVGRYFSVSTQDLNKTLLQFADNPEEFFTSCLNYLPPQAVKLKSKKILDEQLFQSILSDLKI
jgi:hypothetical protein